MTSISRSSSSRWERPTGLCPTATTNSIPTGVNTTPEEFIFRLGTGSKDGVPMTKPFVKLALAWPFGVRHLRRRRRHLPRRSETASASAATVRAPDPTRGNLLTRTSASTAPVVPSGKPLRFRPTSVATSPVTSTVSPRSIPTRRPASATSSDFSVLRFRCSKATGEKAWWLVSGTSTRRLRPTTTTCSTPASTHSSTKGSRPSGRRDEIPGGHRGGCRLPGRDREASRSNRHPGRPQSRWSPHRSPGETL